MFSVLGSLRFQRVHCPFGVFVAADAAFFVSLKADVLGSFPRRGNKP